MIHVWRADTVESFTASVLASNESFLPVAPDMLIAVLDL